MKNKKFFWTKKQAYEAGYTKAQQEILAFLNSDACRQMIADSIKEQFQAIDFKKQIKASVKEQLDLICTIYSGLN